MKPRKFNHETFANVGRIAQAQAREAAIADGLREFAKHFGFAWQEPLRIDSRGEYQLFVNDADGHYGDAAAVMNHYRPRCGRSPGAHLMPASSWCRMNHFDVALMLEDFFREKDKT